jgi:L,D-peptidoglycan transpeptidase YkuD (ErfK/YbiS/YcfS/YnhG family)
MWRADDLYDVVVVLGYNDRPRLRGRGSAIFMHIARGALEPTEGCIALRRSDFRKLLPLLGARTTICIGV